MVVVTLNFTNEDARYIEYALRGRYNKDKRTGLSQLCEIAIRTEVANQSQKELRKAEEALD